jgi:hypothetical protein
MGVLSEIDGPAPCYPAFPQLALIHQWHRDGVNHARAHQLGSRLLAGPLQPGTMFQCTPGRAPSPHPPGGRPTARASVNGYPYGTKAASASPEEVVELGAAGHPRAVLGEQLAPGPGQPPSRAWEGDDRAAPRHDARDPPLARATVSVTTNHLAESGERLPGRRPLASPLAAPTPHHPAHRVSHSLVRRTRRPRCPRCRRGAGGHATVAATPERRVDGEPLVGSGGQFACWPADGHHPKQVVFDRRVSGRGEVESLKHERARRRP